MKPDTHAQINDASWLCTLPGSWIKSQAGELAEITGPCFFSWQVTSSCGRSRPIYIPMKSCAVSHGKATVSNVSSKFRKESHQQRQPGFDSSVLRGKHLKIVSRGENCQVRLVMQVICTTCWCDSWLFRTWLPPTSLTMSTHNECTGEYTLSYSFNLSHWNSWPVGGWSELIIWYLQESDVVPPLAGGAGYQLRDKQQKQLMKTKIWKGRHKPKALEKGLRKQNFT